MRWPMLEPVSGRAFCASLVHWVLRVFGGGGGAGNGAKLQIYIWWNLVWLANMVLSMINLFGHQRAPHTAHRPSQCRKCIEYVFSIFPTILHIMDLCSGGGCSNALTAPFDDSSMRGNGWDVIVAKSNQMFTVCSLVKLAQVVKFGQWIHTVHVAPHKLCTYKHFVWHDAFVHVIFNQTSTNSDTHTHT